MSEPCYVNYPPEFLIANYSAWYWQILVEGGIILYDSVVYCSSILQFTQEQHYTVIDPWGVVIAWSTISSILGISSAESARLNF